MSYRREDAPLLEYIRNLEARVARLEGADKGIRQNNIRIGGVVVSSDFDENQVVLNRVTDDEERRIGNVEGTIRLRFVGYGTALPTTTPRNGDVFIVLSP